jgi:hypothetical protein
MMACMENVVYIGNTRNALIYQRIRVLGVYMWMLLKRTVQKYVVRGELAQDGFLGWTFVNMGKIIGNFL